MNKQDIYSRELELKLANELFFVENPPVAIVVIECAIESKKGIPNNQ